jgi:dTDP-4-dehydrorhamnose reductase
MKILVTGSNGLLGQKLSALLLKDETVYPILTARGEPALPVYRGEFRSLDITRKSEVDKVLRECKPDVVINTAAMTLVDQCETQQEACWTANVTSVENLIASCKEIDAHLIHVSTDFIFDGSNGPLDEQAQPNPVNFYGKSKAAAEKLLIDSQVSWCILRTVLVYGITHDMARTNIVLWVKENLEQGKTIRVVNDQWRTPTLAEDLAQGCYLAALQKAQGIFNISGKDFITPYGIALKTAAFFKLDSSLVVPTNSSDFTQTARRPLRTGFIIDKAIKHLGYEPHSFEEGLQLLSQQISHRQIPSSLTN